MAKFSIIAILGLVASGVHATPVLQKRIAQVIAQSTTKWEQACVRSFFLLLLHSIIINLFY